MDVLEAIRQRRSIRKYKSTPLSDEQISQVLEAGRWAPSAHNSQARTFIVIKNENTRRQLAEIAPYGRFLAEAPAAIAVAVDPSITNHPAEDGAASTQNMLLAACAIGLGSCWIGSYDSAYEERAKQILGIPRELRLLSMVALGYAGERGTGARRNLAGMVRQERYS